MVTMSATTPEKGRVAEPGFVGDRPRKRSQHDVAGFGLPPGIDDWAAVASNRVAIPHPRFRIDWFPDCAQAVGGCSCCVSWATHHPI